MEFSFIDDSNNIRKISIDIGTKWSDIKSENDDLTSVFEQVDRDGDGFASKSELDLLNRLIKYSDKNIKSSDNDGNLNISELKELNELLKNNEKSRIIDTSKPLPENFSYIKIEESYTKNGDEFFNFSKRDVNFDSIDLSEVGDGRFYMRPSGLMKVDKNSYIEQLEPVEIQKSKQSESQGRWSEGLDRRIDTIRLINPQNPIAFPELEKVYDELDEISEQLGFNVEIAYAQDQWIEDYAIRRADGKIYVQPQRNEKFLGKEYDDKIIAGRSHISIYNQGGAYQGNTEAYMMNLAPEDIVQGKSYLEGGNVLNTLDKDGQPAAVIGYETMGYTLASMGLKNNSDNIIRAKQQIADDLGIKSENITYIPQFDFHIDMMYHPLHNGEMAIPDYDAALNILKNTPKITGMTDDNRQALIKRLKEMKKVTEPFLNKAEQILIDSGYSVQKIPFFSVVDPESICGGNGLDTTAINFLNGIGGTSKDGKTYFITNKSDYPEINNAVELYFKKAGIDRVFFVSTGVFLSSGGGIDCLTQEN